MDCQSFFHKFLDFGIMHKKEPENMYNSTEIAFRIKELAKSKNIIIKNMFFECGLNKNILSSMLSGGSTPKSENLAKIADYLDCSVDYLLGRTDVVEVNQSE